MPALKNSKHEAFCRNIVHKRMTQDEAYEAAGYRRNKPNASRLRAREEIVARIAELQASLTDRSEWTAAKRLKTLADISKRNERKDPRVTIAAIGEANRMQGSYPPSKHQFSGPNGGPIPHVDLSKVSDEDLDKLETIFGPLAGAGAGAETEGGV